MTESKNNSHYHPEENHTQRRLVEYPVAVIICIVELVSQLAKSVGEKVSKHREDSNSNVHT